MVMAETNQPPLNSDECRAPTLEDVVRVCCTLNEAGARYVKETHWIPRLAASNSRRG